MFFNLVGRWRWELALLVAVLVTAAILVASEMGHDRIISTRLKITNVEEETRVVAQLMGFMADAETGQRGFLLTQRPAYLEPYRSGVAGAKESLKALTERYLKGDDAEGVLRVGRIATLVGEKFAELDIVLRRAQQGEMDKALELTNMDIGRNKMGEVRKEIAELIDYNNARASGLRQEADAVSKFSRVTVAGVTAVNIILLVIVFRLIGVAWREKEREAERLKAQEKWLDGQVRERTTQLEDLSVHLQDILEAEKVRLARELHDELGAILTAAKMDVAWVRRRLGNEPKEVNEKLERTLKNIDQGIMVKRQLIEDLRPSTLSSFGLVVAARELAEDSAARNEWELELELPEEEPAIGPDTATALYRVLQETLNNATKYASAKRVQVHLVCDGQELKLTIEDDGLGFRMSDIQPKSLGIVGMRQRVQARGGSFEVVSNPGHGCRVRVVLPLKRQEHCEAAPEGECKSDTTIQIP